MPITDTLRKRLITTGMLVPVAVLSALFLPTPLFALLMGFIVCLGAWEWSNFVGLTARSGRIGFTCFVAACLATLWFLLPRAWDPYLLAVATIWWLVLALVLWRIDRISTVLGAQPTLIPVGLLVLLAPWLGIVALHGVADTGPWMVLSLFMLIWIADSAAYFAGRRWGRRKLAPVLSPGKTLAGLYGGLAGAAIWGLVLVFSFELAPKSGVLLILVCAFAALLSVVGDLFESLLKRQRGLKDSGSLLPGHGGVLDRIDSMTAAAPIFALGMLWLENAL